MVTWVQLRATEQINACGAWDRPCETATTSQYRTVLRVSSSLARACVGDPTGQAMDL
uniref:Uncharacterized protein n=1 Tax=Arundo donax TaxID=35708 RepID=A0A0A8Z7C9_ARUDO